MVESPVKISLPKDFHSLEVDSGSDSGIVVLRAELLNKYDVERWISNFERQTSHKWNVQRRNEDVDRFIY